MNCRLCLSEGLELRKSHIIPELCYYNMYDSKHRFVGINTENYKQLIIEQNGFREALLCQKSETYLSKWEYGLKWFLDSMNAKSSKKLIVNKLSPAITEIKGSDYIE